MSEASLNTLKRKIVLENKKAPNKIILCNLTMDKMSIKSQINVVNGKQYGYITTGRKYDSDCVPEAQITFVVMLVAINSNWKTPVAYYFVGSLTGKEKAEIIQDILINLQITGSKITSLTFDGLQSNFIICKYLGVKVNVKNLEHFFLYPVTSEKVFIILDWCHILKLIKNSLVEEDMIDETGQLISWSFLIDLENF